MGGVRFGCSLGEFVLKRWCGEVPDVVGGEGTTDRQGTDDAGPKRVAICANTRQSKSSAFWQPVMKVNQLKIRDGRGEATKVYDVKWWQPSLAGAMAPLPSYSAQSNNGRATAVTSLLISCEGPPVLKLWPGHRIPFLEAFLFGSLSIDKIYGQS